MKRVARKLDEMEIWLQQQAAICTGEMLRPEPLEPMTPEQRAFSVVRKIRVDCRSWKNIHDALSTAGLKIVQNG